MRAFHSDQFVLPLPPGHSFPMSKYRLLREAAEATLPGVRVTEAVPASEGELALAHEPSWISAIASLRSWTGTPCAMAWSPTANSIAWPVPSET